MLIPKSLKAKISNSRLRAKLRHGGNKKKQKMKKIVLIATLALATGCCLYFSPPLKTTIFRLFFKLSSLVENDNCNTLIENSSSKNGRTKMLLILGSTIVCSIFLLNSASQGRIELASSAELQPTPKFKTYEVPPYEPWVLPSVIGFMIAFFCGAEAIDQALMQ